MMQTLPTALLRNYVRRCEAFEQTTHQNYADAVAELERRKPRQAAKPIKHLVTVDSRINGHTIKQRISGTLAPYLEEL